MFGCCSPLRILVDNLKNEVDPKNEDDLKNKDSPRNQDNIKKEGSLKNEEKSRTALKMEMTLTDMRKVEILPQTDFWGLEISSK